MSFGSVCHAVYGNLFFPRWWASWERPVYIKGKLASVNFNALITNSGRGLKAWQWHHILCNRSYFSLEVTFDGNLSFFNERRNAWRESPMQMNLLHLGALLAYAGSVLKLWSWSSHRTNERLLSPSKQSSSPRNVMLYTLDRTWGGLQKLSHWRNLPEISCNWQPRTVRRIREDQDKHPFVVQRRMIVSGTKHNVVSRLRGGKVGLAG